MPTPPALTVEQRRQAYLRSLELRQRRAVLKEALRQGRSLSFAFAVNDAEGMKVFDLLVCLPGIGRKKALRLLAEAGMPEKNTVRACGPKQRERLLAAL